MQKMPAKEEQKGDTAEEIQPEQKENDKGE